jgi:hypothetical protein
MYLLLYLGHLGREKCESRMGTIREEKEKGGGMIREGKKERI